MARTEERRRDRGTVAEQLRRAIWLADVKARESQRVLEKREKA
jgi:hypothetical protein